MNSRPMSVELNPDTIGFVFLLARPIPDTWCDQVKSILEEMINEGIIAPVRAPTDSTHLLTVVAKRDATLRIWVGMAKLNKQYK